MQIGLNSYLFRTINTKPSGLKVRLRIKTVAKSLITFEERSLPGASIMWQGLFLERPTQTGVKDPMLVAVINQNQLSDDEVKVGFGVFSEVGQAAHGQSEIVPLPKQLQDMQLDNTLPAVNFESTATNEYVHFPQQRISISRYGIVKRLPIRVPIDLLKKTDSSRDRDAISQENFYYCMIASDWSDQSKIDINSDRPQKSLKPFLIRPFDHLISSIDELISIPKQVHLRTSLDPAMPFEPQNNPQIDTPPGYKFQVECALHKFLKTCASILCALQRSIYFLSQFEIPQTPADLRIFDSTWQSTQQELTRLAYTVRDLFFRPLAETVEEVDTNERFEKWMNSRLIRKSVTRSLRITEELIQSIIKQQPPRRYEVELPIEPPVELKYPYLCREAVSFLADPPNTKTFCSKIEASMQNYDFSRVKHIMTEMINEKNSIQWRTHVSTTDEFFQVSEISLASHTEHKVCQRVSAKGGVQPINTGPALYGASPMRLDAVFSAHGTTFFVVTRDANSQLGASLQPCERITQLKLFREGVEIASYETFTLDLGEYMYGFNHFTGRFLLSVKTHSNPYHMHLLDLAPCMKQLPEAPIMTKHKLTDLLGQKVNHDDLAACTDDFLSYFLIESNTEMDPKKRIPIMTNATLHLVRFDATTLGRSPVKISLTAEYLKVSHMIEILSPNLMLNGYKQICWSNNRRTLFHMISNLDDSEDQYKLLIVCYEVSASQDAAKLVAFSCTRQKEYLPADLYGKYTPRSHTLRTESREYLVVDITSAPKPDIHPYLVAVRPVRVLGRLLFTLHKNKLHKVLVNGQHLYRFPAYIGNRIRYAGYESCHLSLFHQRRVFSSDKVVSAAYRLDYKPL